MSITDELRQVAAKTEEANGRCGKLYRGDLDNIADRIDAEHEKAAAGCIHYDPERHYYAVHGDTENGWVRLPVDADGVPIRVGDKINVYQTKNLEVVGVGDGTVFTHHYMGDYHKHYAGDCHVVKQPTVEDMLEQFLTAYDDADEGQLGVTTRDVISEYAAKLRLAGEGE